MPMTTSRKLFAIFILILSSQVCASAQSPTNACGGQPLCVETSDFNATVTSFRTSTGGTSRIINVSVRFQKVPKF